MEKEGTLDAQRSKEDHHYVKFFMWNMEDEWMYPLDLSTTVQPMRHLHGLGTCIREWYFTGALSYWQFL